MTAGGAGESGRAGARVPAARRGLTSVAPRADSRVDPRVDPWSRLRATTRARIGLPRTGDTVSTGALLEFRAAHAAARDAVHEPLDVDRLYRQLAELGCGNPLVVRSRAEDRATYVRRPDLGREPSDLSHLASAHALDGYDLGLVVADGLSPRGVQAHGAALCEAILGALPRAMTVAPPVIATQARVALGDHVARALGVRTLLVVIGERPGLSVPESVGVYLTHDPRPGLPDSRRNCVSNVHPPDGLSYEVAARTVVSLVAGARQLGTSGVALKDVAPRAEAELDG